MAEIVTSKVTAEVFITLMPEQEKQLEDFIKMWQTNNGLIIGSLGELNGEFVIGFRQFPKEIASQIFKIAEDFYLENGE